MLKQNHLFIRHSTNTQATNKNHTRTRSDQSLKIVTVAIQNPHTLFNTFITSSPYQLINFTVEVNLKNLCYLQTTQNLKRHKPIRKNINKKNNIRVDLFHHVISFIC